jgi:hypothetical protein
LVSSTVGIHDLIYVRSETGYLFENGVSSSMTGGVFLPFEWEPHLLHRHFARVYPHSRSVQARAFVPYGHHTPFVTLLQRTILMQDINRTSVSAVLYDHVT